ncbi:TIFY [Orobanche hederae]
MPESDAMPPEKPTGKSLLEIPMKSPSVSRYWRSPLKSPPVSRYLRSRFTCSLKTTFLSSHAKTAAVISRIKVPGGTNMDAKISVSAERSMPHHVENPNKPDSSGVLSGRLAAANDESAQPRAIQTTNNAAGQMTIIYGGKANVYDGIPTDKARTILHIAASPLEFPEEQLNDGTVVQPLPGFPKAISTKARQDSAGVSCQLFTQRKDHLPEKHQYKDILRRVQRYLEKRNDREGLRVDY